MADFSDGSVTALRPPVYILILVLTTHTPLLLLSFAPLLAPFSSVQTSHSEDHGAYYNVAQSLFVRILRQRQGSVNAHGTTGSYQVAHDQWSLMPQFKRSQMPDSRTSPATNFGRNLWLACYGWIGFKESLFSSWSSDVSRGHLKGAVFFPRAFSESHTPSESESTSNYCFSFESQEDFQVPAPSRSLIIEFTHGS